jgi:uncharacterized protein
VLRIGVMLAAVAAAFQLQIGQLQIPAPIGFVNDFANVIPAENAARIQRIIEDVRGKSRGDIAVVTLPDLKGRDPADVALRIGRSWKVGSAGNPGDTARNRGVVLLVVPKETSSDGRGHVEIQTGLGTEGFLTDATTGEIQDEALPLLGAGDYGGAIELITLRIAQRFASEFNFQLDTGLRAPTTLAPRGPRAPVGGSGGINPIVWLILFFIVMSLLSSGRRRRGCGPGCLFFPFPIGGGWGGGTRGGGGGFGGGGSGRSW